MQSSVVACAHQQLLVLQGNTATILFFHHSSYDLSQHPQKNTSSNNMKIPWTFCLLHQAKEHFVHCWPNRQFVLPASVRSALDQISKSVPMSFVVVTLHLKRQMQFEHKIMGEPSKQPNEGFSFSKKKMVSSWKASTYQTKITPSFKAAPCWQMLADCQNLCCQKWETSSLVLWDQNPNAIGWKGLHQQTEMMWHDENTFSLAEETSSNMDDFPLLLAKCLNLCVQEAHFGASTRISVNFQMLFLSFDFPISLSLAFFTLVMLLTRMFVRANDKQHHTSPPC